MPKRVCHFTAELEKDFPFIEKRACKGDSTSGVYCKICSTSFSIAHGGRSDINQHTKSNKHKDAVTATASSQKVPNFFTSKIFTKTESILAAKEAVFAYHTVKHNHSFRSMDCTTRLIQHSFEKQFTCSRTKCEAIAVNVLFPDALNKLKEDLKEISYITVASDSSGHGATKLLPIMIRFFQKYDGVKVKILDLHSIPGETSDIILGSILRSLEDGLDEKVIALCADNTNTNFGGVNRKGQENVLHKFKTKVNKDVLGIGCAAHIVHNSIQTASDCLPIDVELLVFKIYNYFHIYTVRTEELKEFCEFTGIEYQKVLGSSKTRWLSLSNAVERLLKLYTGIKSYFLSQSKCPKILKDTFNDPCSELYLWFLHSQLHSYNKAILQMEKEDVTASEVATIVINLISALESRQQERFIGLPAKTLLKSLIEQGLIKEKTFYASVDKFYETAIMYLKNWIQPFEELLGFSWMHLNNEVTWKDVENCLTIFRQKRNEKIEESALFDEIVAVKQYVTKEKITEWSDYDKNTFKNVDKRWVEIFTHFRTNHIEIPNVLLLVEFSLALPGTNASAERVFSLMNNMWTPEKSQLKVETLRAMLTLNVNVQLSCSDYYEAVKRNEQLLKKIHATQKYL